MIKIIWSEKKNRLNIYKHRIDFEEAKTVFYDPLQLSGSDPDHSYDEQRFITIGMSAQNRLIIVAHTARKPTRREKKDYEKGVYDA